MRANCERLFLSKSDQLRLALTPALSRGERGKMPAWTTHIYPDQNYPARVNSKTTISGGTPILTGILDIPTPAET